MLIVRHTLARELPIIFLHVVLHLVLAMHEGMYVHAHTPTVTSAAAYSPLTRADQYRERTDSKCDKEVGILQSRLVSLLGGHGGDYCSAGLADVRPHEGHLCSLEEANHETTCNRWRTTSILLCIIQSENTSPYVLRTAPQSNVLRYSHPLYSTWKKHVYSILATET